MTLPVVPFGRHRVTRLIMGGNPLRGNSHFTEELSREMGAYHTYETVSATFRECERNGINTVQMRGDAIIFDWIDRYRKEGGRLQWILQTASEWTKGIPDNIREIARHDVIGIYHHGSKTDNLWKEGKIEQVGEYLKVIRDTGLVTGLGTHMPEVIEYAEEHGWDLDFYMACLHNLSKIRRESVLAGGAFVTEPFDEEDRATMGGTIRKTKKPCCAFKILSAGRKCGSPGEVRQAFAETLSAIKPHDVMIAGMWQKHANQVKTDADMVRDLLS